MAAHIPLTTEIQRFQGESSPYCLVLHVPEIKLSEGAGRASKTDTLNTGAVGHTGTAQPGNGSAQ